MHKRHHTGHPKTIAGTLTALSALLIVLGASAGSFLAQRQELPEIYVTSEADGTVICNDHCKSKPGGEYKFCYTECLGPIGSGNAQDVGCDSTGFVTGAQKTDPICTDYGGTPTPNGVVTCNNNCRSGDNGAENHCYDECSPNEEGIKQEVWCKGESGNAIWVIKNKHADASCGGGGGGTQCQQEQGTCLTTGECTASDDGGGISWVSGKGCEAGKGCCKLNSAGEVGEQPQCVQEMGKCVSDNLNCTEVPHFGELASEVDAQGPKGCSGSTSICCKPVPFPTPANTCEQDLGRCAANESSCADVFGYLDGQADTNQPNGCLAPKGVCCKPKVAANTAPTPSSGSSVGSIKGTIIVNFTSTDDFEWVRIHLKGNDNSLATTTINRTEIIQDSIRDYAFQNLGSSVKYTVSASAYDASGNELSKRATITSCPGETYNALHTECQDIVLIDDPETPRVVNIEMNVPHEQAPPTSSEQALLVQYDLVPSATRNAYQIIQSIAARNSDSDDTNDVPMNVVALFFRYYSCSFPNLQTRSCDVDEQTGSCTASCSP